MTPASSTQTVKTPRQLEGQNVAQKRSLLLSNSDVRPDPKVLSSSERLTEFGQLMLRAIERRQSRLE